MIEEKGLGNKKINRVGISLSNRNDSKLRKLATACGMGHTTLAGLIIEKSLNNAQMVAELQKEYCIQSAYKVVVINNKGELNYVLSGREDL
ncbi:hypothetical protein BIV60_12120 [Bacillus sp. MUM 116]|uniref:hypothetical protein n=1 Tax=Bacillus sp. MUM 116 TaxID=1678002 RepID=UPI0008F5D271|nr:hypothetical protein [Bacillus sp. MUM 116]OIK14246.1 hypothetical protein BIV60_12120 [Bacillus sp. MUM 116]